MYSFATSRRARWLASLVLAAVVFATPSRLTRGLSHATEESKDLGIQFVQRYCLDCHEGSAAEADLNLACFDSIDSIAAHRPLWRKVLQRVRDGEMPPEDGELPEGSERDRFVDWIVETLRIARSRGSTPGPALLRRLNRTEYAATIRDLLGIHINSAQALPSDGAGGEGFDNASETLFISPIHAEKYLDAARSALGHAFSDSRAQRRFLTARPSEDRSPTDAARRVLSDFLPRAFRRSVDEAEVDRFMDLFSTSYDREPSYNVALQYALEAVLVSPEFLFIVEAPNRQPEPVLLGDHELATRLSYFLWASAPDAELLRLADEGKLNDDEVLARQVIRMLGGDSSSDGRGRRRRRRGSGKVRDFAESFVEQWLGTRALGREFQPDPSVGRYDSELEGGMKYEPVFFFEEILTQNRSLLDLLDSDYTYANRRLARHYGIRGSFREQPKRTELPNDGHRGGVLGMAAVLAVSSYPHRTSPVLRGKWVLETLLGDPPPPPPPNVPELNEQQEGQDLKSLRQRLEQHRENPACAACHDRIDPIGFGLENYDVLGRWRDKEAGLSIDASGHFPDGTEFDGPAQLKQALMDRKDQFIRHLTAKMLGYALARGLTSEDYNTVDDIVRRLIDNDYLAHTLILGIVRSVPFRYKSGTDPTAKVKLVRKTGD